MATAEAVKIKKPRKHPTQARRVDLPGSEKGLDLTTLAGRLAWARINAGMTQTEVARRIEKARQTVTMYETNAIKPAVDTVEELAAIYGVSASYLAFGEHGIKGIVAEADMINIPEISFGKDGEWQSGTLGMPRSFIVSLAGDAGRVKAFVLAHNSPSFDLQTNDRILADTTVTAIDSSYDQYLLRGANGMEMIRVNPLAAAGKLSMTNGRGKTFTAKASELDIIGAVVGTLRHG